MLCFDLAVLPQVNKKKWMQLLMNFGCDPKQMCCLINKSMIEE